MPRATAQGTDFIQPTPGTISAVCTRVIDLGTQATGFKDDATGKPKQARKVLVQWELAELMEDGRPFLQSATYTLSISPKAILGQHLVSWRGVPFTEQEIKDGYEVSRLLGQPCLLTLVKEGEWTNVKGVMKLPKEMKPLERLGPLVNFDLDAVPFQGATYDALSEKLRAKIALSPQYEKAINGPSNAADAGGAGGAGDDDIPF